MNAKELERYITGKPNARKKIVPEWQYIRYTAYAIAFATLQKTDGGAVLTVYGRNERLEKEYAGVITPSETDERFTNINFPNSVPDTEIKQLIDGSYAARMRAVTMPDNASGRSAEDLYNGVKFGDFFASDDNAQKEVAATKEEEGTNVEENSFPSMPYRALYDDDSAKCYNALRKQLKK